MLLYFMLKICCRNDVVVVQVTMIREKGSDAGSKVWGVLSKDRMYVYTGSEMNVCHGCVFRWRCITYTLGGGGVS